MTWASFIYSPLILDAVLLDVPIISTSLGSTYMIKSFDRYNYSKICFFITALCLRNLRSWSLVKISLFWVHDARTSVQFCLCRFYPTRCRLRHLHHRLFRLLWRLVPIEMHADYCNEFSVKLLIILDTIL